MTTAIPPTTSTSAFSSIFEPPPPPAPSHSPFIVVDTLGEAIDALEQGAQQPEDPWEETGWASPDRPVHSRASVPKNIHSRSRSAHLPFTPPPPPQSSPGADGPGPAAVPRPRRARATRPRSRSWTTTIVVTEFTAASGSKSYAAASTPLTRVPVNQTAAAVVIDDAAPQRRPRRASVVEPTAVEEFGKEELVGQVEEPMRPVPVGIGAPGFAGAVYNRVERPRGEMIAISVRRQRKLKMKRHKYKKLMKRTRNVRRKLGKL